MRKKLFRMSLGLLSLAATLAAAPAPAMALDGCPGDQIIDGCDCILRFGLQCSECHYDCQGCGGPVDIPVDECAT